ncbi:MAG: hypothetical protein NVSMB33_05710 [Ktedonobacteraceae bacterium]
MQMDMGEVADSMITDRQYAELFKSLFEKRSKYMCTTALEADLSSFANRL